MPHRSNASPPIATIRLVQSLKTMAVPRGFLWGGMASGLKPSGKRDLAIALCKGPAQVAGFFTRHHYAGAPIEVAQDHLARQEIQALVVNSGNANVFTGAAGLAASRNICKQTAHLLGLPAMHHVLPASTGVIGEVLPVEKILRALPHLTDHLGHTKAHLQSFAEAILTTDQSIKVAHTQKKGVRFCAIAKGAGMIAPELAGATMLCYIFADTAMPQRAHTRALQKALTSTLDGVSIDGDTSTSDMSVAFLSGASGIRLSETELTAAYSDILREISQKILLDGEGATRVLHVLLRRAPDNHFARRVARSLSGSILVKSALYGGDANWGRILMAIGKADLAPWRTLNGYAQEEGSAQHKDGATMDVSDRTGNPQQKSSQQESLRPKSLRQKSPWQKRLSLTVHPAPLPGHRLAPQKTKSATGTHPANEPITIKSGELPTEASVKRRLQKCFRAKDVFLEVDFHSGRASHSFAMTDLSEAYLRFNSAYTT